MSLVSFHETGQFLVFERLRPYIRKYILKAGIGSVPYSLFGGMFWVGILMSLVFFGYFVWPFLMDQSLVVQFLGSFISIIVIVAFSVLILGSGLFFYYDYKIFQRTKQMEEVLPDFLRYVSENLQGGLSFEKALWQSIKPRFGVLASEIRLVAKRVMTGEDIDQALEEFTQKYNSVMLNRSFQLIIESLKGGSQMAGIIENIQENIRESQELKKEISAVNSTYVMFIALIVVLIAPGLFALGYTLLHVLGSIASKIAPAMGAGGMMGGSSMLKNLKINPDAVVPLSMSALTVISIFSSFIISIIKNNNAKQGLLYIPVLAVISFFVYLALKTVLYSVFGSMIV